MYTVCDKIRDMTPYTPITGTYAVRLDANESYADLSPELRQKLYGAIDALAFNRYPDPYAVEACEAFAAYYGISPDYVTAGNGSDELISILAACFLETGDTVVTVAPDFSMYAFYNELYEKKIVTVQKNPDLSISVDAVLEAAKEQNAKAILFSNPCNPTGQGLARDEVRRLIRSTDALVVLDEAYMDFWDQSLLSEVEQYDNLIILRTCSKALGLAALRLGFAVANPTLTRALRAAKSPYNVNSLTQGVAAALLRETDRLQALNAQLIEQRKALDAALREMNDRLSLGWEIFHTVTNFVLVRTANSRKIFEGLLEQSVAIRCLGDCLRITAPSPEELPVLLAALEKVVAK